MKVCTICKLLLPAEGFQLITNGRRHSWCSVCKLAYQRKWIENNKEHHKATVNAWKAANKEKVRNLAKKWKEANIDKVRAATNNHYKENRESLLAKCKVRRLAHPEKWAARVAARAAAISKRSPSWTSTFDRFVLIEAFALCVDRTKLCGGEWNVDHIIPLRGAECSGLHVHNNIAVVPRSWNRAKGNKLLMQQLERPWLWVLN